MAKQIANDDNAPVKPDDALEIAENRSSEGLAATTLRVVFVNAKGETSDVSVHLVINKDKCKTLVVGEQVSPKLLAAFKEAGITHVDRHAPNAKSKIDQALRELTGGMREEVKGFLVDAFKYRNDVDLGKYMFEKKLITAHQLEAAQLEAAQPENDAIGRTVGEILLSQGAVTSAQYNALKTQQNAISLSAHMADEKLEMTFGKYVLKAPGKKLAV